MKHARRLFFSFVAVVMAFCMCFAACTPDKPTPDKPTPDKPTTTYTVLFSRNCEEDVTEPDPQTVQAGEKATRPADPARRGYEVEGWYLEAECKNAFDFDTPITEDLVDENGELVLYANWVAAVERYTVTFDAKGGSCEAEQVTVVSGGTVPEPAAPTKQNMVFKGWFLDDNTFASAYNFSTAVTGSFTLYAKWVAAVKVTYDLNYEGSSPIVETIGEGDTPENKRPERDKYTFGGWFTNGECTTAYTFGPVTNDITLYANWISASAQKYTYTFDYNYAGAPAAVVVEVLEGAIVDMTTVDTVTNHPQGKSFKAWYENAQGTGDAFDIQKAASGNKTLYAAWQDVAVVTFHYNYEGASQDVKREVVPGGLVQAPATPVRPGNLYTFAGWSTAADIEPDFDPESDTVEEDIDLYAQWSRQWVIEGEDADLTGLQGWGFSGDAKETSLIRADGADGLDPCGASNGYYLYSLNGSYGFTITWKFTSDRDVTGADFYMRLSAELQNIFIMSGVADPATAEENPIVNFYVNGVYVDYNVIDFTDVPPQSSSAVKPFEDFGPYKVNLVKGENTIQFKVENSMHTAGGTTQSDAPMLDCFKLTTSAVINFTPKQGNY